MINKIKGLVKINEELARISEKFDEHSSLMRTFNGHVYELRAEIDKMKNSQNELVHKMKEDSESLKDLREELNNEINDFKLMKCRMEQKLIEKFEEELKQELVPRFDRLEKHVKGFEDLSGKVGIIANRIVGLSNEVQKFNEISKEIKKEDFELTKFAHQLKNMNNEKLELMKKIDTLERLISKMRRNTGAAF